MSNGTNDAGSATPAQIAAYQTQYVQAIRANPFTANSLIIILGVYAHNYGGTACTACVNTDAAEHAAAAALNDPLVVYCPWVNDPSGSWETGTGSISSQNGTGNVDFTFETVAQHNNFFGNRQFAARIVRCVRSWMTANGY
jgi:hypothetical protein